MLRKVQEEGWSAYTPEHLATVRAIIETLKPPPEIDLLDLLLHSTGHCLCLLYSLAKKTMTCFEYFGLLLKNLKSRVSLKLHQNHAKSQQNLEVDTLSIICLHLPIN